MPRKIYVNVGGFEQRHDRPLRRRVHPPQLVTLRDDPRRAGAVNGREVCLHPIEHILNAAINVRLAVEGEHVHALG